MRTRTGPEETQLRTENPTNVEESNFKLKEEEDIIIKCGLDEMVKRFFKDYVIVWHDPNVVSEENKQYIVQLENFCEVHTFTEWKEASDFVTTAKAACHVITSGSNGESLVKEIDSSQNIFKIYIFCGSKDRHSTWAKNYKNVSCIENRIQNILDQIEQNLLKWYKEESSLKMNLPAFATIFNDWDKSGMNNLHHYLKVIPNFKNRLQAKKDILTLSRRIYSDKMNRSFITDFEENYNEYNKEVILKWYTQESFLFKVTNNCLRIASCDSIQYCRLVLKDLEQAIKEQYQEKSKHFSGILYRAASLSDPEWSSLKANLHRDIEMHGFLSVSKDKNQALKFIQMDESKNVFITILVPKGMSDEEQGFAEVEELSIFPQEKEIIFNVRSRFTVLEAEENYSKELHCRHLVLLYGAQGFRKYLADRFPVQERSSLDVESISCSICCQDGIAKNMYFRSLVLGQTKGYLCKECLPEFLEVDPVPLLCIPQGKPLKQIKLQGVFMTYPMNLEVPMYGYQCYSCQKKMKKMYYKCTECHSESKKVWCDDCLDIFSECMQKGHEIILESKPFSFWCEKMSQGEIDHLKLHDGIIENSGSFQLGKMYSESHEYQKAIEYYKMYIQKDKDKKNHVPLARAYKNLADIYQSQADFIRAFEFSSKALEIFKLILGENHFYVAGCSISLGQINENQAEYEKALEYYSKALEIVESSYGGCSARIAICYNHIGQIYEKKAEYKKAHEYHFKALEIRKTVYGRNHPDVATSYGNLGNIYRCQAEYQNAFEYHSKALEIRKSFYGENHPGVATSYSSLGSIYYDQADYQRAFEYYLKALEIDKSFYGENHPEVATSYCNLGSIYKRQGEYQKAFEYHSKALRIRKTFYGENHPGVATSYSSLGNISYKQADYQRASEYRSKALEIRKSLYGENHPEVVTSYDNLGSISYDQPDYQNALEYYSKALGIRKSFFGDNHPNTIAVENKIQELSEYLGNEKKSKD